MPGISLLYNHAGITEQRKTACLDALRGMHESDDYSTKVLLEEKRFLLTSTAYPEYPIAAFHVDEFDIFIEGRVYNKNDQQLKGQLVELAQNLLQNGIAAKPKLESWLLNADGEFVIYIYHKLSEKMIIFNDVFSRLPSYYYKTDDQLIVSRLFRFMAAACPRKEIDRTAIAEYLMFFFCLGNRTMLKDVCRLEPAALMLVDPKSKTVKQNEIYKFNFEEKKYAGRSIKQNADNMISLFTDSCRRRVREGDNAILSLSGGLDSRAVGACFSHEKIPFNAISWLDPKGIAKEDISAACEVAQSLGVSHEVFRFGALDGRTIARMLRIKCGLVPLGKSFSLAYFQHIKQMNESPIVLFNGNGGAILKDKRPPVILKSFDDFVQLEVARRSSFNFNDIHSLVGIARDQVVEDVDIMLSGCVEKTWDQRFVHSSFYAGWMKRWQEGEDRSRSFFWATSPFWSIPLFQYMINCPDDQKTNYKLYAKLLEALHPYAASLTYANTGMAITGRKDIFRRSAKNMATRTRPVKYHYSKLKKRCFPSGLLPHRRVTGPRCFDHSESLVNCLTEQMQNSRAVGEIFSTLALKDLIGNNKNYTNLQMSALLTVMSAIELLMDHKSTVDDYSGNDFSSLFEV